MSLTKNIIINGATKNKSGLFILRLIISAFVALCLYLDATSISIPIRMSASIGIIIKLNTNVHLMCTLAFSAVTIKNPVITVCRIAVFINRICVFISYVYPFVLSEFDSRLVNMSEIIPITILPRIAIIAVMIKVMIMYSNACIACIDVIGCRFI